MCIVEGDIAMSCGWWMDS